MRTATVAGITAMILLAGCAGGGVSLVKPEITLAQLPGTALQMQYAGTLSIPFILEIKNQSQEEIELESIALWTIGDGPYLIDGPEVHFKVGIQPNETKYVRFLVPAFSQGGSLAPSVPVTIRGSVFFDSPVGRFRSVFTQQVRQPTETGLE